MISRFTKAATIAFAFVPVVSLIACSSDSTKSGSDAQVQDTDASLGQDAAPPSDTGVMSTQDTNQNHGSFTLLQEGMTRLQAGADGKIYGLQGGDLRVFDGQSFSTIANPCKAQVGDIDAFVLHDGLPGTVTYAGKDGLGTASGGGCTMGNPPPFSSHVTTLFRDSTGNLWAGSQHDGAHRFDGSAWTTWNKDNSDIQDNWVCAIIEDKTGTIWLGNCRSQTGSPNDQFNNLPSTITDDTLTRGTGVGAGGTLWVLDKDGGLWMVDSGFTTQPLFSFDGSAWTTHSNTGAGNIARAAQVDSITGDLFIATNERLLQITKTGDTVTFTTHGTAEGLPFENILEFAITGDGVMLMIDTQTRQMAAGRPTSL